MVVTEKRPDESMVGKGFLSNPKGAGIAWREGKGKSTVVRWKKGLDLPEAQELVKTVPMPFVFHCRMDSVGGPSKLLTHPFTVDEKASLDLEGTTKGGVLFHNGTWTRWKEFSLETAAKQPSKLPSGIWSDTRALAWNASIYGLGVLEFIDEKVIVFTPETLEIFGDPWDEVNGVLCSNRGWCSRYWNPDTNNKEPSNHHSQVGKTLKQIKNEEDAKNARKEESGGTPHQGDFRTVGGDGRVEGRAFEQEQAEELVCNVYEDDAKDGESDQQKEGKIISCAVSHIGPRPNPAASKSSHSLTAEDEMKSWALAIQPKHRSASVVKMPLGDSEDRARRLENHRRGIQSFGRI